MAERSRNTSPSAEPKKAPQTPEGFVPKDPAPGDPAAQDAIQKERDQKLLDRVEASDLEAAPEDQRGPTGGSFVNPAHVGSGTILPDGTYGAPLPDPNVEKLAKLAEDTKDSDTSK